MTTAQNKKMRAVVRLTALNDLDNLYFNKEDNIYTLDHGIIRGHFAGNEYFFYKNGKELFRSSDYLKTLDFLIKANF